MSKRAKVADLPEFDGARYLDSESSIAAYLTDILEANDAALLASALGDIARARGMTEIAKSAGICVRRYGREALRASIGVRYGQPGVRGARGEAGGRGVCLISGWSEVMFVMWICGI